MAKNKRWIQNPHLAQFDKISIPVTDSRDNNDYQITQAELTQVVNAANVTAKEAKEIQPYQTVQDWNTSNKTKIYSYPGGDNRPKNTNIMSVLNIHHSDSENGYNAQLGISLTKNYPKLHFRTQYAGTWDKEWLEVGTLDKLWNLKANIISEWIPKNTNIDDLTKTGTYQGGASDYVQTYKNSPWSFNPFSLIVDEVYGGFLRQFAISLEGIKTRTKQRDSPWQGWKELTTSDKNYCDKCCIDSGRGSPTRYSLADWKRIFNGTNIDAWYGCGNWGLINIGDVLVIQGEITDYPQYKVRGYGAVYAKEATSNVVKTVNLGFEMIPATAPATTLQAYNEGITREV